MQEKTIKRAVSRSNGIAFYSTVCPEYYMQTIRTESGAIYSEKKFEPLEEFMQYVRISDNECIYTVSKQKILAFDLALILLAILFGNFSCVFAALYFSALISFHFFNVVNLVFQIKTKNGNRRSFARYHSAEHMACEAYEKLQRVPTLDEIKKFPRISKLCGSRIIFQKIFFYLCTSILIVFCPVLSYPIYMAMLFAIMALAAICKKYDFLLPLQFLITSVPTDEELEVAIECLKQYEKMENDLQQHQFDSIVISMRID